MPGPQADIAEAPLQLDNPLNLALNNRNASTLKMVHDAIRHKQTLLAFQPIVLASDPNRVAFYEGLIRVTDDTGRIIPAAEFIPVVENTELGRELDALALEMGLEVLRQIPDLRLSINMSALSISNQRWKRVLRQGLDRDPTVPERLILEVTETSAMAEPERIGTFMERLQEKGVCFALDDFGSGQTALRYFKDFYFDMLKIDGQFIAGISEDPDNQALVASMQAIASHFDMVTVAEFVEQQADAECLAELGLDCLQGYLYGAPTTKPSWLPYDQRRQVAS